MKKILILMVALTVLTFSLTASAQVNQANWGDTNYQVLNAGDNPQDPNNPPPPPQPQPQPTPNNDKHHHNNDNDNPPPPPNN